MTTKAARGARQHPGRVSDANALAGSIRTSARPGSQQEARQIASGLQQIHRALATAPPQHGLGQRIGSNAASDRSAIERRLKIRRFLAAQALQGELTPADIPAAGVAARAARAARTAALAPAPTAGGGPKTSGSGNNVPNIPPSPFSKPPKPDVKQLLTADQPAAAGRENPDGSRTVSVNRVRRRRVVLAGEPSPEKPPCKCGSRK